jgi:hypothetical protein
MRTDRRSQKEYDDQALALALFMPLTGLDLDFESLYDTASSVNNIAPTSIRAGSKFEHVASIARNMPSYIPKKVIAKLQKQARKQRTKQAAKQRIPKKMNRLDKARNSHPFLNKFKKSHRYCVLEELYFLANSTMDKIPPELWWEIANKMDDVLFNTIIKVSPYVRAIVNDSFWQARFKKNWIVNLRDKPPAIDAAKYAQLAGDWETYLSRYPSYFMVEILHILDSPCSCPYHFSMCPSAELRYSYKQIVCAPAYIPRKWFERCVLREFYSMNDVHLWRRRSETAGMCKLILDEN